MCKQLVNTAHKIILLWIVVFCIHLISILIMYKLSLKTKLLQKLTRLSRSVYSQSALIDVLESFGFLPTIFIEVLWVVKGNF